MIGNAGQDLVHDVMCNGSYLSCGITDIRSYLKYSIDT